MANTSRHRPRRAAVYARVSLDQTGEAASISQQEESARELIERRGWTLAGVYVDNSITGTGKKHRPQFYAMLEAVKGGEVDAVVARHMDRIARNPRERLELVEACRNQGVIIALVEGSDMDPTTASGRMVIDVLGSVAEMEIGIKSERHTAALRRHAHNGGVPHGPAPYGYTTTGDVVPDEASIVGRIFQAFDAGGSLRSITAKLTADGVPSRSGRPWNVRTVRDMLTNPRYAGWAIYRREIATDADGNRIRAKWEPIVAPEVFDVVQARLSDPSRKSNRFGTDRRYLGSSLFLCDACGGPIQTGNGGKYLCPGHLTRESRHVDRYVIDVIAERLGRKDFAQLLAPPAEDMAPVVAEAERLRKRLRVIDGDYDRGDIDAKRWKSAKQRVQTELAEVDHKLAARRGGAALGSILSAPDPAAAFRDASLMAQRATIDALAVVRLRRAGRGRLPAGLYIDPETVDVDWQR
ncbi:recombinase family protein [Mycobacterium intracellulare]|uniref:recombinase family protein n=1 Tax=Mycobacterium intracellulare TaxID=1767 RepID=UPI001E445607|nr:recombinase family protein [Mycobacterium intracellulare]UGT94852.1 recombinase family protein [Mycobacterium intracellulare]UQB95729.1 recombinase family protein [Mycobacterium intracellulare]